MVTTLALLLFGAAGETRGAAGIPPEQVPFAREEARVHAGVGAGALFGVANADVTFAPTLVLDLGVVLRDRLSLVARLDGGSAYFSVVGAFSVVASWAFSDRFSVGLGAKVQGWLPLGPGVTRHAFFGVLFPVRVEFAPFSQRIDGAVARSGFVVGLEAAPGVSVLPTGVTRFGNPIAPEAGFTVALTAGYALW